ncbi:nuclear protein [Puccinia graminis f. sp. tritici]|uniref:Non-structural maintenance of chromosomes element 4 n=1 Tax=Puccinia graminis f. sp. tritici TaxID=56615 RepID=A0A5B0NJR2_PUCGR|nr:nuclear protein [Puccinia graminis f. sp. tritici]
MSRVDRMRMREQEEREDSEQKSFAEDHNNHDASIKQTQPETIAGTNEGVYNPHQDKDKVRGARKVLRNYEETASSMKDNATVITAEEFNQQVIGLDDNFKSHVRAPAEATIDSRALRFLSETALKKSKLFKIDINAFDPDEFVLRFRQVMTAKAPIDTVGNSSEDEEGAAEEIDWCKVGKRLMRYSRRAPAMDLMYGPLEIQQKKRKLTQRVKLEKHESDMKQPELIDNNDIERSQAEMSALIKKISDLLTTEGGTNGINLFQFFINPGSFSQSVENLFCLSFLIRDGKAAIDCDDEEGVEREFPVVYSTEPAGADVIQEDGFTKTQIILELTMQDWQDAIDLYGIESSIIPDRPDVQATPSNSKKSKWH